MVFSHHSHSGEFCAHAKNTLEEMVLKAIKSGMKVFALTEHMPRDDEDLYPEEVDAGFNADSLATTYKNFYTEAARLRKAYSSQIHILIGFEADWIRPSLTTMTHNLLSTYTLDFFIGSVHHVNTIPIDFDRTMYERARDSAGGTDEKLAEAYFDQQYDMLRELKPPVVGHFDLVRLLSDDMEVAGGWKRWEGVWEKITRNLQFVADYDGLLEVNSSALRKGMSEPYPKGEVCEAFLRMGGRSTLSDDSHSAEQVGLNYHLVHDFLERTGISQIYYLERREGPAFDDRFPGVCLSSTGLAAIRENMNTKSTV